MEQRELEQAREQESPAREKGKKRPKGGPWWKLPLTVVLTLVVWTGGWCLALGADGMAVVQGWLLARFAFVEPDADLSAAADRSLEAMVTALGDRWSYYRSAEDYEALKARRANNYVGIGITVTYTHEEGLYVQSVTAGGPAEGAGILPGDIITAVDGTGVAGDDRVKGTELITGEEGTRVALTLLRSDGSTAVVTCTRATIRNPTAYGKMLEGDVGYVRLESFYTGAAECFQREVDALVEQGAKGLIIDLRDDPGGYIAELTRILDYLLPEGEVFRQRSRWWFETVDRSDAACIDLPFVTLVNADTYSCAEIMAAELREFAGAPVVGERTCGKGYSQLTFPLINGGGLGLSTANYTTGSGVSLIGVGIIPDVELEQTGTEDVQLQAALELLTR